MPLFRGSVGLVRAKIEDGSLIPTLREQFAYQLGHAAPKAEITAWTRSLDVLSADLMRAGLADVEALIEYQLPLTSKRADVVLCGRHPKTNNDVYVVVELKQWTRASLLADSTDVVELDGMGERLHPVEQVRRYCTHISDFAATFDGRIDELYGVAYLHNASDADVSDLWDLPESERGRLFTGQRRGEFLEYLAAKLAPKSGAAAADRLLNSSVRPSKQLMALAADEVQNREQFVLLDEQKVAYSLVLRAVEQSYRSNTKEVIVVSGGPGSGKSVIALSLLGELSRRGMTALHATGSSAFTKTLRKVAGSRAPRVQGMFKYFNQFITADRNGIDVLICDEAHRLRETSENRYTKAIERTGKKQVLELIDAARVPVFLLDEHQVVRPGELGTVDDIRAAANEVGLQTRVVSLDGQFRCGGSSAYEQWVLRLLGLQGGGPTEWMPDGTFELKVAEAPSPLEQLLAEKLREGYGARIAAGYCWKWSDAVKGAPLADDVVIGDWKRPWNNKKETRHEGAPGTPFWATDEDGFDQVGCIYTAQGFEYDYAGVIFGPDLVWRTDHWVAQPDRSYDSAVTRGTPEEFDRSVRNAYKVLLTRGMRGTVLFSTDPETQRLFEQLVSNS